MLTVVFLVNFLGMIILPILLGSYIRRRFRLEGSLAFAGALTFIAAQIFHVPFLNGLTTLLNSGKIPTPPESLRTIVTAILLGLAAGIFEETARWILFKFIRKDVNSWSEGLLVGVGHGSVEALVFGALGMWTLINMIIMRNTDLSTLPISAEQIEQARQEVTAFWSTPMYVAILGLVERIFTMCLHLALSVMVLYSVVYKKSAWFWMALLWHALVDATSVYFASVVDPLPFEGIVGLFAVVSLLILFRMKPLFVEAESPLPGG